MPNLEIMRPSGSKIENNCHIESSWRLDNLFWHQKQQRDVVRTVDLSSLSMFSVQKIISAKSQRSQQKKTKNKWSTSTSIHISPHQKKQQHLQHFHYFLPPQKKQVPTQPPGKNPVKIHPSLKVILLQLLLALSDANGKPSVQGRAVQLGMSPTNCTVLPGGVWRLFCAVGSACLKGGGSGCWSKGAKPGAKFWDMTPTFLFFEDSNAFSVLIGFWLGFIFSKKIAASFHVREGCNFWQLTRSGRATLLQNIHRPFIMGI